MYSSGQPVSWLIQSTMVSDMKEQVPWIQFLHTYHKIVILHYDLSQYQGVSVSQRQHGIEVLSAEYFYLSYLSQTLELRLCILERAWLLSNISISCLKKESTYPFSRISSLRAYRSIPRTIGAKSSISLVPESLNWALSINFRQKNQTNLTDLRWIHGVKDNSEPILQCGRQGIKNRLIEQECFVKKRSWIKMRSNIKASVIWKNTIEAK